MARKIFIITAKTKGLSFPHSDGDRLEKAFLRQGYEVFRAMNNAAVAGDSRVTSYGNLIDEISDFCKNAAQIDTLVIYFSGHGKVDNDGTLTLHYNDNGEELDFDIIHRALRKSPASHKLFLLDCCYSGAAIHHWSPQSDKYHVLSACAPDDKAWEVLHPINGSLFTYFLCKALNSGIPKSPNSITLRSINDWLYGAVSAWNTENVQRENFPIPSLFGNNALNMWEIGSNFNNYLNICLVTAPVVYEKLLQPPKWANVTDYYSEKNWLPYTTDTIADIVGQDLGGNYPFLIRIEIITEKKISEIFELNEDKARWVFIGDIATWHNVPTPIRLMINDSKIGGCIIPQHPDLPPEIEATRQEILANELPFLVYYATHNPTNPPHHIALSVPTRTELATLLLKIATSGALPVGRRFGTNNIPPIDGFGQ